MIIADLSAVKVKAALSEMKLEQQLELIPLLKADGRKAINQLAVKLEKNEQKRQDELLRLQEMQVFESEARKIGYINIAGLDEAGRGPLMGPVVASAVILPENCIIEGLNDSKKLSEQKREELFVVVKECALAIGVGIASHTEIDEINILNATKLAMKRAIDDLGVNPDYLLIDAVKLTDIDITQESLIKGDSRSLSIAAASVIAKVTRDRLVSELATEYPGYGFEQHKGYGTQAHYDAIRKLGVTPVHRMSFLKNFL